MRIQSERILGEAFLSVVMYKVLQQRSILKGRPYFDSLAMRVHYTFCLCAPLCQSAFLHHTSSSHTLPNTQFQV